MQWNHHPNTPRTLKTSSLPSSLSNSGPARGHFYLGLGSFIIREVNQWWSLGWLLDDLLDRSLLATTIVVIIVRDDDTFTRLGSINVALAQDCRREALDTATCREALGPTIFFLPRDAMGLVDPRLPSG
jgi:hypothetical protein